MAKGYLVDAELRCIRFRMPGSSRNIRCSISFNTLAQSFGAPLPSQAEDAFVQHRQSIEQIAQRLISGGRPDDADGWMWIRAADCSPGLEPEQAVTEDRKRPYRVKAVGTSLVVRCEALTVAQREAYALAARMKGNVRIYRESQLVEIIKPSQ